MATHAYIGFVENNLIKYIYIHYGENEFKTLNSQYNSFDKAKELINRGHMNSLFVESHRDLLEDKDEIKTKCGMTLTKKDIDDNIYKNWGEVFHEKDLVSIRKNCKHLVSNYYIFNNNNWKSYTRSNFN